MAKKSFDFSSKKISGADKYRFGIVVSKWNSEITGKLYEEAYKFLTRHGISEERIITAEVPGSFELTAGAELLLNSHQLDCVICLGCVIQGETRHFEFICNAVANGITQISIKHNKPVIFGVLTTDTVQQAIDRSGGKHGNKGEEAAATALHMAELKTQLKPD